MNLLFNLYTLIPDIIGLLGVILILYYYFLLQIGKCASEDLGFSLANFVGSILLLISLVFNWNLSSVIIEIAWLFISLYGIIKYFNKLQKRTLTS